MPREILNIGDTPEILIAVAGMVDDVEARMDDWKSTQEEHPDQALEKVPFLVDLSRRPDIQQVADGLMSMLVAMSYGTEAECSTFREGFAAAALLLTERAL
jgi:hypothetical protein